MPFRLFTQAVLRLAALGLVLVGLTANFTGYPLLDPDEGRNASIAWEMTERGDFVLPRLDGLPYADKPMLHFATAALSMRILGATEFAARLPSLAFTLATLVLIGVFADRRFGREERWVAVVATGATPLTLAFARTVIFDAALTFFVTVALVAFYEGTDRRTRPPAQAGLGWSVLAWAAIGLGILTKGPIALALPLMIAAPYAASRRPSWSRYTMLPPATTSGWWLTTTTAAPAPALRRSPSRMTAPFASSRLPVGSSASKRGGSFSTARQ